ncbi:PI-PLC X domain-containing protein 1-like isoform X2 [Sinocyclocheilus anshuiensis]|uniref:PI-PLC X domain-containing protein 1-like isoform X2 n=1 Tax=Sinocyclocheilus anshuiensis TaxID=1608454 RepID=UPI0007B9CE5C|nr:PREDICTED: PI-PLC X domain-containing protein 1-like isoform X2 [Sinocyclocheilus anshuiensis]
MDHIGKGDINHEEWMSCLPEKLWDVPLTHLSIPGSHDAMSCLDITSPLLRSESDTFRLLDGVFCCFTRPAIYRWATTQVQTIVEQLTAGIRYFDLRIAHKQYDSSNELYFTHVIYTHATVVETLQTVASWLESHPKEIIILACSHFEGLDYKRHEEFIYSLKKIFGSKLCPCNEVLLTLRSLWTSGYQVVLSYEDQSTSRHKELWPAIPYLWANKPNAEELIHYLECQKQLGRPGLNLTTDRCFIASHPRVSLRTLTMENWNRVKKWLEDQKPGAEPTCLNIIAGDFIGPVPFCSLVIALNKKLL